jgi:pyruvate/2-oxoglutarate dehydrogenase complex dihydrolipoamide dehydrogenase (E3) component
MKNSYKKRKFCSWRRAKAARDALIKRRNDEYEAILAREGIPVIRGWAQFEADGSVLVNGTRRFRGRHTLVAVGSKPIVLDDIPGAEYGVTSDGFFGRFLEFARKKFSVFWKKIRSKSFLNKNIVKNF